MTTNNKAVIYLAMASALVLGSSQMRAETDEDSAYMARPDVRLDIIEEEHEVLAKEHDAELAVELEKHEEQIALEQEEQELEMVLELREDAAEEEGKMSEDVAIHDARMAAYLKSRGINLPK